MRIEEREKKKDQQCQTNSYWPYQSPYHKKNTKTIQTPPRKAMLDY